jgi:hypothetical protein
LGIKVYKTPYAHSRLIIDTKMWANGEYVIRWSQGNKPCAGFFQVQH